MAKNGENNEFVRNIANNGNGGNLQVQNNELRAIRDHFTPSVYNPPMAIALPEVGDANFEIKP